MSASAEQVRARPSVRMGEEAFAARVGTAVWWLTNAGFLVNARGTRVMIDPAIMMSPERPGEHETGHRLLVELPLQATEVPGLEAVCYTHADYDHFAPITARELVRTGAWFVGPPPVAEQLAALGVPEERVWVARVGEVLKIGEVEIRPTPADHPWQVRDPAKFGRPWESGDCCGYLLTTPEGRIWHPGDTRLMEEHLRIGGVEVLLLDVSRNQYHLGVEGAARLAEATGARHILPHHYGCYDAPEATEHNPYNGDPAEVAARISDAARRLQVVAAGEELMVGRESDGGG